MGHHNRHYAGDPHSAAGVWSPSTSTANFCEEDYAITLYIAEFINTLTNLAYIWFALRYPKKQRSNATPGFGLDLMSVSLVVLGINSFIFHATLRHTTQYCDEISMFLLGSALIQGVFTINQSLRVRNLMTAAILAIMTVLSAIYIQTGNILHHVWSFNAMMGLVGLRTMFLIFTGGRPREEKARLLGLFGKAVAVLVVAYTLWQIDLEKCMELRWIREALGLPWAWLLELHGWWHVLTALGASRYIRLIRELSD